MGRLEEWGITCLIVLDFMKYQVSESLAGILCSTARLLVSYFLVSSLGPSSSPETCILRGLGTRFMSCKLA